jgi:hypothetical protein
MSGTARIVQHGDFPVVPSGDFARSPHGQRGRRYLRILPVRMTRHGEHNGPVSELEFTSMTRHRPVARQKKNQSDVNRYFISYKTRAVAPREQAYREADKGTD